MLAISSLVFSQIFACSAEKNVILLGGKEEGKGNGLPQQG